MTVTEEPTAPAEAQPPAVIDRDEQVAERQRQEIDAAAEAALAMPGAASRDEFLALAMQAKLLSMSGAAPKAIRGNPHVALHIAMIGRDLGISPSAAVELIDVIETSAGPRPSLSPQLMNGQLRRLGLGSIKPAARSNHGCYAVAIEPHGRLDYRCARTWPDHVAPDDPQGPCQCQGIIGDSRFGWEDAQVAGLIDKRCADAASHWVKQGTQGKDRDNRCDCVFGYKTYPDRMFWWRCLPVRAEALTPTGWVAGEKVNVGDEILAFDTATGECVWDTVGAVHHYEAAETFSIGNRRSFRAAATANHEWVTDRWDRQGQWEKTSTGRLASSHTHTRLLVAAPMRDSSSSVSAEDAARLGWIVTDGTIQWHGDSPSISISQSKHVAIVRALFPTAVEDVRETVTCPDCGSEFIPKKGHIVSRRPEHRFRLNAAESRRILDVGGIRKKEDAAVIPARLDNAGRRAMFEAMALANGEHFCTGHEAVWDCWQILAAMLGMQTRPPLRQRGSLRSQRSVHEKSARTVKVARLSISPATVEPVWCPTTSRGTWVARLDGQVFITGNSSGFCADDYFPEAGMGLYQAEALGAVVDVDGRAIDPATVELPDGYERQGSTGGGSGDDGRLADPDVLWQIQLRVHALPEDAQAEFKKRWMQAKIPGRLTAFPAAKDKLVESLLRGVEQQWKARNAYDPETGPAQFAENVLAPAVAAACRSWASQTAVAAPEPESAPDTAEAAPAAPAPAESTAEAEPDGSAEEAGGTLPLDDAGGDPTDGLLAIPDTIRAADDDVQFEWLEAYVKMMRVGEVDTLLRDRYGESTKGSPTERRERLAEQIAVRELGKQHPDHPEAGSR